MFVETGSTDRHKPFVISFHQVLQYQLQSQPSVKPSGHRSATQDTASVWPARLARPQHEGHET